MECYSINPQILTSILLISFLLYVGLVWIKFGVQKSISDSYYSWSKNWGILFTLFCWLLAFPLAMMAGNMPEDIQFIPFFSGAGFGFVGAASMIKRKSVARVHFPAALIGMVFADLILVLDFGGIYIWIAAITAILGSVIAFFTKIKNKIWWAEIVIFIGIMGSFVAKYFFYV